MVMTLEEFPDINGCNNKVEVDTSTQRIWIVDGWFDVKHADHIALAILNAKNHISMEPALKYARLELGELRSKVRALEKNVARLEAESIFILDPKDFRAAVGEVYWTDECPAVSQTVDVDDYEGLTDDETICIREQLVAETLEALEGA